MVGGIFYILYRLHSLSSRYKKLEEDVKTLYGNQRMLLSLTNALRARINNIYGKKEKSRSGRESFDDSEFGIDEDDI